MKKQEPSPAALSRRRFIAATVGGGAGVAAWSLLGSAGPAYAATGRPAAAAGASGQASVNVSLNRDWLFGGAWVDGSDQPGYDDSQFLGVTLPHTVTPLSWQGWQAASWERVWVYRRHFDLPAVARGMRTFVDFQGAATSATPTFNGTALAQHLGGYLPFSYELTDGLAAKGNVLAVKVDATWQNVPPDGNPSGASAVDYFEPGGIYRDVALRFVPQVFLADVFALPDQVLTSAPVVNVVATVDAAVVPGSALQVTSALYPAGSHLTPLAKASAPVQVTAVGRVTVSLQLSNLGKVSLWDNEHPHLYDVVTTLTIGGQPVHDFTRRIGFREAVFQTDGFFLNGNRVKLFGLNRHQLYPYDGMAMPARVQQHDAQLLKRLNCNIVRCSHYPQDPSFLDACDELGIMVWEETPGWGYLGNAAWQQVYLQNVHDMVIRDRSRPSVVIWGVTPNEAPRSPAVYDQAKQLAASLDSSRQASGSQTQHNTTNWDLDVFAYDDYSAAGGNAELQPPIAGVPYLVTEAVGALDGAPYYRWFDTQVIQQEQARLHAQVHNIAGSNDAYAGLLGWCGFDYDSPSGNIYQDVKWPGVVDTFRVPKPGASFYLAQGDPAAKPVIEPAFYWDFGATSPVTVLGTQAMIWSNCDQVEAYLGGAHLATLTPATSDYPYLAHPPFYLDVSNIDGSSLPELRLDGYLGSAKVLSRSFAADHGRDRLALTVDDLALVADGSDTTRVVFRAVDKYGAPRPYPTGNVTVTVDGPAIWLGELLTLDSASATALVQPGQQVQATVTLSNGSFPFAANGGVGGVYLRTLPGQPGLITVRVAHPTLGAATAVLVAAPAPEPPAGVNPAKSSQPSPRAAMTFSDVAVAVTGPSGWQVAATSATSQASLPPGASFTTQWQVTAPASVSSAGTGNVTAKATFTLDSAQVSQSAPVPVALASTLAEAFNNTGISDDSNVAAANFDGASNSYSAQALAAAGLTPGATFTHDGITFSWPDVPSGEPDNVLATGQAILLTGTGGTLGFIGASSPASEQGTGTVHYSDGSTSSYSLTLDNYWYAPGPENDSIAALPYVNDSNSATNGGTPQRNHGVWLCYVGVPITQGKTVTAVTLPTGGSVVSGGRVTGMHIFALGIG